MPPGASALPAVPIARSRWSADTFVFLRQGGLRNAVEPTLGGSQALIAGRRALGERLAVTGRLTSALSDGRARQAEVAVGVGVRPMRSVPVELVGERRVALSDGGRDAWQLRAVGGVQVERGGWRLESYGQAGVVGTRSRDLFADGQLRVSRPLVGPIRGGGIVAGAAQPGASRVDVGPQFRVDVPGGRAAVLVDYRLRVAGNAAPASGPSVTLAASF